MSCRSLLDEINNGIVEHPLTLHEIELENRLAICSYVVTEEGRLEAQKDGAPYSACVAYDDSELSTVARRNEGETHTCIVVTAVENDVERPGLDNEAAEAEDRSGISMRQAEC